MPKTKSAFAFRDLYSDLFDESEKVYNNPKNQGKMLLNPDDTGFLEVLLKYLDGGEIKFFNDRLVDFDQVKELENIQDLRLLKYLNVTRRIKRHVERLKKYERRLFSLVLDDSVISEVIVRKGRRARGLQNQYIWIADIFEEFQTDIFSERKMSEIFDRLCRKNFGGRLRQARLAKKLSISEVAKSLGLSRTGYGYYELGQRDLPTPTIYRLAKKFDVSTDWLFGLKN